MSPFKWTSLAATGLSLSVAAVAQEQSISDLDFSQIEGINKSADYDDNTISIYFRGGLAGENIAQVLEKLYSVVENLPVRSYVIEPNDSVCQVLSDAKYPSPCRPYLPLIERLSALKDANVVWVGQEVKFPDVELVVFRSSRPVGNLEGPMLDNIVENWSHLNIDITTNKRDGKTRIEFDTFEVRVKAPDEETRDKLVDQFLALDVPNTFIETAGFGTYDGKTYQVTESQVRQSCDTGEIQNNPVDYSTFTGSVISDLDIASGRITFAATKTKPKVFVLDVEMTASPNLDENAPSVWDCEWHEWKPEYHATHLAGIVASRTNGHGFIGLEPTTDVIARPYRKVEGENTVIVTSEFNNYPRMFSWMYRNADFLPIYLMASSYRTRQDYGDEVIRRESDRFESQRWAIEKFIKEAEPLLIIAAGQEVGEDPIDIRFNTPLAPQNLGDQRNVISVASCVDCSEPTAKIDPISNYSEDGMVHVAAPGGDKIPGWVNNQGIGASRGTSQASAFTAGVAARMLARFPEFYVTSDRVKQRIQSTSRPMVDENGDLSKSANKIAAGIVDPRLAMLDPRQDWQKDMSGWRSIKVEKLSKMNANFVDAINQKENIDLSRVRRIVQHSGGQFTLYLAERPGPGSNEGAIERKHFFQIDPDEDASLILCDGTKIPLRDILDFLPRAGGVEEADVGFSVCQI